MTDSELNALIAEKVMGWVWVGSASSKELRPPKPDKRHEWAALQPDKYTTDLNACREAYDRIEVLGLSREFFFALGRIRFKDIGKSYIQIVGTDNVDWLSCLETFWRCSSRTQCEAMAEAVA